MTALPDTICPLCSDALAPELLHDHIAVEHPPLRHGTIKVIQAYHPWWSEEHGACESCWKSYRDAGRVLHQLKSSKPQTAGDIPLPAHTLKGRA